MRSPLGSLGRRLENKAPVSYVPSQASVLPYMQRGNVMDMDAMLEAYVRSGVLQAIVGRLANTVSSAQWNLYRKSSLGMDDDREMVTTHAALTVWNRPNNFFTRQLFVETFQQHLDLTGVAYWIIARSNLISAPIELWPVRPDRIIPIPSAKNFLAGYVYRSPDGVLVPLELDEVIQLRMPDPRNVYAGTAPTPAVLNDMDAARFATEWNRNFFINSAEPGGVIEVGRRLGDSEFQELLLRWKEQHRGVARAHRVALLEEGTWKDRSTKQKDMQFAELYTLSDEKVRQAFGYPKPMLGSVDDVNRANAEAGETVFARWLQVPRLERIKGALNNNFLPMFGDTAEDLEFDYVSPVPEDKKADSEELTAKVDAAVKLISEGFDPVEVCEFVGLPPMMWDIANRRQAQPAPSPLPPATDQYPYAWGSPIPPAPAIDTDPEAAMRWVAVEEEDDSTCEPCKANRGKLYKNREEAFKDYPGGVGFKDCVGAQYGNKCRGKVVKRKAS